MLGNCSHCCWGLAWTFRLLSLRTRISLIISARSNCQAGHLCFNTVFFILFFFFFFTFYHSHRHTHISHHKDSPRQGQRGPALLLWTINTHRWPARPAYPQMATAEQDVWKVSGAPAWHPWHWACRCQTGALTRIQQVDVGAARQGSVCPQEEAAAPWERRMKGRIWL